MVLSIKQSEILKDECLTETFALAQVRSRWLLFTENKGEDVADYIKKEGHLQM